MQFGGSVPPQITLFKKEHSKTKNYVKNDLNQVIFLKKSCDLNRDLNHDLNQPTLEITEHSSIQAQ